MPIVQLRELRLRLRLRLQVCQNHPVSDPAASEPGLLTPKSSLINRGSLLGVVKCIGVGVKLPGLTSWFRLFLAVW